ncbi:dysbindin-A-like isoform X2 [Salarias fasciatus]|uniref:Dysbindin-A-like n=1 Tax=Salarias fasciatus TaxID=181472 RepID=A0A672H6L0_SALFA|nr:dysbindin-A-like isoform X2 [Salarias fasciatus]
MFENFRERLQMVQQDFTAGFKTLGEKSRDGKMKRRSRTEDSLSHFTGGMEILHRYEESWFVLHRRTKDCAQAAEAVYGDVVMLSALWEKKRSAVCELQEQLQSLPAFLTQLDAVTTGIAHLEGEFEEMESRLVYLEMLCSQCEQQAVKLQHHNQMENYKKKKRKELESLQVELNVEHEQKLSQLEQTIQQKLKERQKAYEQAFKQDVDQYLSTGYLQSRESTGAAVFTLDQMTVANMSDQDALDDFLNSSEEDLSAGSSLTSGPDLGSNSSESVSQAPPTHNLPPSLEAAWPPPEDGGSEDSDEPVVQSDEEEVEADGLQDVPVVQISEDSDSAGDFPSG